MLATYSPALPADTISRRVAAIGCMWSLFLLASLAAPSTLLAAWRLDGVILCESDHGEHSAVAAIDGDDGAIVAWVDTRAGNESDIYAQRVDSRGTLQWDSKGSPVCTAAGDQSGPAVVEDGNGGAIIVWTDTRSGGTGIYAQRLSHEGLPQWAPNGVPIAQSASGAWQLALVSDGAGGAIVLWERAEDSFQVTVRAQRVSADGIALWQANGNILSPGLHRSSGSIITLASDHAGDVFAAWTGSLCCSNAVSDIFVQRLGIDGVAAWLPGGVPLRTGSIYLSQTPLLVPDYNGGTIVAWQSTGSTSDIVAQSIDSSGSLAWATVATVCGAPGSQSDLTGISDGAGGAIMCWRDFRDGGLADIYAQRIDQSGLQVWTQDGVQLSGRGNQFSPRVDDGADGAPIVSYVDESKGAVMTQRLGPDGTPEWPENGSVTLLTRSYSTTLPGASGLIVVGDGSRFGNSDVIAGSVSANGEPGYILALQPTLAAIHDLPSDQGGWCVTLISSPPADVSDFNPKAIGFNLWRREDDGGNPVLDTRSVSWNGFRAALSTGSTQGLRLSSIEAAAAGFPAGSWLSVGFHAATQSAAYDLLAPTTRDSTEQDPAVQVFVATCHTNDPSVFAFSNVDSGYSVDNLSPPVPMPFTATYAGASNTLRWGKSPAADLREFRLYRGTSPEFMPGSTNLVAATRDTGYVDGPGAYYYKLAAVDVHGNVSRYALVSPDAPTATLASLVGVEAQPDRIRLTWYSAGNPGLSATVYRRTTESAWSAVGEILADGSGFLRYEDALVSNGVRYGYRLGIMDGGSEIFAGETWAAAERPLLMLEAVSPNPAIGGDFTVRFVLPSYGRAMLELIDIAGRRVSESEVGSLGPGRHTVDVASRIRVSPGVYLVRLSQGGQVRTARVVILR